MRFDSLTDRGSAPAPLPPLPRMCMAETLRVMMRIGSGVCGPASESADGYERSSVGARASDGAQPKTSPGVAGGDGSGESGSSGATTAMSSASVSRRS